MLEIPTEEFLLGIGLHRRLPLLHLELLHSGHVEGSRPRHPEAFLFNLQLVHMVALAREVAYP